MGSDWEHLLLKSTEEFPCSSSADLSRCRSSYCDLITISYITENYCYCITYSHSVRASNLQFKYKRLWRRVCDLLEMLFELSLIAELQHSVSKCLQHTWDRLFSFNWSLWKLHDFVFVEHKTQSYITPNGVVSKHPTTTWLVTVQTHHTHTVSL